LLLHSPHCVLDIEEVVVDDPFLMNTLWHLETKESNKGVSLLASNLANSFAMLWMRLISQKFVTRMVSAFLEAR